MPKLSYNAEFGEGDDLYGYSHLKFRSMAADRSYIRENIVYNMVESAGLPGTHISYIRFVRKIDAVQSTTLAN